MSVENKHNVLDFESCSMRKPHGCFGKWPSANHKRFLTTSIRRDRGKFCCLALTNPSEVVILGRQESSETS